MKKYLLFSLLVFGYTISFGQGMPNDITAPYTISPGDIQVELTYNYGDVKRSGTEENTYQGLVRYGMARNFELIASWNQYRLSSRESHISDGGPISLGTNLYLIAGQKWWPAVGLVTTINVPVEDDEKISSTIRLNLDRQINSIFNIGANLQTDFGEHLSNAYSIFPYVEAAVTNWSSVYVAYDYGHEEAESSSGINIGARLWVIEDMALRLSYTTHFDLEDVTAIPESIVDFGLVYRFD